MKKNFFKIDPFGNIVTLKLLEIYLNFININKDG